MNTLAFSPRDFISEICREQNINFETLSQDYITRLSKDGKIRHVMWSNWDINPATADRIACDKSACYIVLSHCSVPAVPHEILQHPVRRLGWTGAKGTWTQALKYFDIHKKVVAKPNHGTNGQDVYLCKTVQDMEAAVHAIFQNNPDAALSPFCDIKTEYRVFYANGKTPLAYGKTPNPGNWRHNLTQGATAFELEDEKLLAKLQNLATYAATAININFATIDIVELQTGELQVMEINSGVQARQLLEQLPHLRSVIKDIYAAAVMGMF